MARQPLTTRQREILDHLESFTRDVGYPPTVRELCKATGLKSPRSVSQHLQALERKGYIRRGRDKSRAIQFLQRTTGPVASPPDGVVVALRVEGEGSVGGATERGADDGAIWVDRRLVAGGSSFLLKVEGDGMAGAHIVEGDYVVVDPERAAADGDVVAAASGEAMEIVRYRRRGARAWVESADAPGSRTELTGNGNGVRVVGVVAGLIRPARREPSS